ncbi:MAG: peptidoglycan binding protein CsiV [Gammaproteobacteria bacterium]|nr:peptidoglycan binding protein CsiV [Gammaproteobacteria bacterium]
MKIANDVKHRRMCTRQIALSVIIACVAVPAFSQDPVVPLAPEEAPADPKRYTVELIVFEYAGSAAATDEIFLPEPRHGDPAIDSNDNPETDGGEPMIEFTDQPGAPGSMLGAGSGNAEIEDPDAPLTEFLGYDSVHLSILSAAELKMAEMYERLQKLDAYRTLLHSGWTQAAVAEERSPAVRIRSLGAVPLRVDGTFTLYLGRYLHLVVDLALEEVAASMPREQVESRMDSWSGFGYDERFDEHSGPVLFRLQEDRIVADGDLRYFDHPKFGVLARITRIEDDDQSGLSGRLDRNRD